MGTTTMQDATADAFLAAALRGPAAWPADLDPQILVRRALYHGVAGLLADAIPTWPDEAAAPLRDDARASAMRDLRHRGLLITLLSALDAAGVRALLLKGAALAYDLYDAPAQRPRGDTDLLVAPSDRARARATLAAQGWDHFLDGPDAIEASQFQERWERRTPDGLDHAIDLHWQAMNATALPDLVPFEAAWARARALPALGPAARALPLDRALLFACAHRAQHRVVPYFAAGGTHYGGDRLIWLQDIDLIARAMTEPEWDAFTDAAEGADVAAVALDGLDAAARALGTAPPPAILARLRAALQDTAAARYLLHSRQAGRAWSDLRAAGSLRPALRLLHGRLLPSEAFLRARFPDAADQPLLRLHLRRLAGFLRRRESGP